MPGSPGMPEFRRDYLVRLPLPLAQLYSRAYNAKDARSCHDNTFYLFECLIKLAVAPGVAAYLAEVQRGAPRVEVLDRVLAPLALPSLGQWVGMLRALARHFGSRPDAAAHPLGHLSGQLEQPRRDPALLALYRRIKNGPDGEPAGDRTCSLLQVFDALVQYRNGVFGHGAGRFPSFYEREMGPLLFPAANEVLAEGVFDLLGPPGSRLVYLSELRALDEHRFEVSLRELAGTQSERLAPLVLPADQAAELAPNRVAVRWPGRAVPLRLDPLLAYRESELVEEVLFLNRDRDGRQVEYLNYTTGRTERDRATAPALAALLSRVTGRPVGERELEALAEQSRATTPSVEGLFGAPPPAAWRLGDYEVLAELGRGGMGVVYLVRQLSLGRVVALKTLPADLAGDAEAQARFRREVRALARCDHPNIVKILSSGTLPDGQPYYSMEYVPGCTLERVWQELAGADRPADITRLGESTWVRAVWSASHKQRDETVRHSRPTEPAPAGGAGAPSPPDGPALPLPPLPELPELPTDPGGYVRRIATLLRDAAQALRAVHDEGLVHRDVKPGNLMLTPDGRRVVLMDFGLAKGQTATLAASRQGGLLGTLRYAAPEQLAAASVKVGPAADVRGLGVTFWELLTWRRLFAEAQDERQLAQRVLEADVPRLRPLVPGLDRDLEALVARATERRLTDRIGSARQLAEYVQLYLDGKPLPIRPPGARELAWRWARAHRGPLGLAATTLAGLLLAAVLALVLVSQRQELRHAVDADLTEVAQLQKDAKWVEARAVLKRAEGRLARGGSPELERRVRQARADLEMVARLEDIPLTRVGGRKDSEFNYGDSDAAYAAALRDYGIDLTALGADEAARRVAASAIREPLLEAIDDWAKVRSELGKDNADLRRLAQLADWSEDRKVIRDALTRADPDDELDRLARQVDPARLPPVILRLLAHGLTLGGSRHPSQEEFLRQIQQAHPDDVWTNLDLVLLLYQSKPVRLDEAIGFLRAAVAQRPESPVLHLWLATFLWGQKKSAEAEREIRCALRINPDYAVAHTNLGLLLGQRGEKAEAEKEFRRALEISPDLAAAHAAFGLLLSDRGERAEAEKEHRRALEIDPDWAAAYAGLGLILRAQGQAAEAVVEYRQALQVDPEDGKVRTELARLFLRQGQWKAAEAECRRALESDPDLAEAHCALAGALLGQREWEEAEKESRRALEIDPGLALAHVNLGAALLSRGEEKAAEKEFRQALATDPALATDSASAGAHVGLGLLLARQKQWPQAEKELQLALQSSPELAEARSGLALCLARQGKSAQAEAEYRRALERAPDLATAHQGLGDLLLGAGKRDEAEAECRNALQLDPDSTDAHVDVAIVEEQRRNVDEAEVEYRQALQVNPEDASTHNRLGLLLWGQGKAGPAEGEYRRALAIDTDFADAHYNLARLLWQAGQVEAAQAEFRRTLQIAPKSAEAVMGIALTLEKQGKTAEAETEYRRALTLRPQLAHAHALLGVLLVRTGKLVEAEAELRQAIRIDPGEPTACGSLGALLGNRGDLAAAEGELRRGLKAHPGQAELHWVLGQVFARGNKWPQAEAEYRLALEGSPGSAAEVHRDLGSCLVNEGKPEEGEKEYRRALEINPGLAEVHYYLGLLLRDRGKPAEAEQEYRRSLEINPAQADVHNDLGAVLDGQGKLEEAEQEYRRAMAINPDHALAHRNLGVRLAARSRWDEAESEYRKAVASQPNYAAAHNELGRLLWERGKPTEAEREYRRALAINPDYAWAHWNLGLLLQHQGQMEAGLASLRRGRELLKKDGTWSGPAEQWLRKAEQLVALDHQLPQVLERKAQPADAAEAAQLAYLCQRPAKRLYAAAVRLYAAAFAEQPKLAEDLGAAHRYDAACAAALAAAGQGTDAAGLDEKERARLREQARAWLRADLRRWGERARGGDTKAREALKATLTHWKEDPDLAGLRDPEALSRLPAPEADACRKIWAAVDALLHDTREGEGPAPSSKP